MASTAEPRHFCIVGGGIAGVCCVEELQRVVEPGDTITLVSASPVLKGVGPITRITQHLEEFEVVERGLDSLVTPNTRVICAKVTHMDVEAHTLTLDTGEVLSYTAVCLCPGARPKELSHHPRVLTLRDTDSVQALAAALRQGACRVAVVGNGGIALELVGFLRGYSGGMEVVWAMKHGHLGDAFFDADAADFLLQHTEGATSMPPPISTTHAEGGKGSSGDQGAGQGGEARQEAGGASVQPEQQQQAQAQVQPAQPQAEAQEGDAAAHDPLGHATGPTWTCMLQGMLEQPQQPPGNTTTPSSTHPWHQGKLQEGAAEPSAAPNTLICEFSARVEGITSTPPTYDAPSARPGTDSATAAGAAVHADKGAADTSCKMPRTGSAGPGWPVYLQLSNGHTWGCDIIVSAVGVQPATEWLPGALARAPDGGLLVDANTRVAGVHDGSVFAAGDGATLQPGCCGDTFIQMRLWTQARAMGRQAGAVMAGVAEELYYGGVGLGMDLFAHATHFLGFKAVFLGLYNGQGLEEEPEGDVRMFSRVLHAPGCPRAETVAPSKPEEGGEGSHGGGEGRGSMGHGSSSGCSFVRILLLRGKLVGAVMIGETDMEEVLENLIMDRLDLTHCAHELLDPDIELDHVFD